MVLNYIWIAFFVIAFFLGLVRFLSSVIRRSFRP